MRNRIHFGALAAALFMGWSANASAQVTTTLTAVLSPEDSTWSDRYFASASPCNFSLPYAGSRFFETVQFTVSTPGTYSLTDGFDNIDAGLGIYSGPFDPASPLTNCIATSEDLGSATLAAGTYTAVLTSLNPGVVGLVTYRFDGPGPITVSAGPAPVPTLSEWALITFGAVLAGAALFIQRRRQAA